MNENMNSTFWDPDFETTGKAEGPSKPTKLTEYQLLVLDTAKSLPAELVEKQMPTTVGDMRDALIAAKIIPASRLRHDVLTSYTKEESAKLSLLKRIQLARDMIDMCRSIKPNYNDL